jgi:hypothetical protein
VIASNEDMTIGVLLDGSRVRQLLKESPSAEKAAARTRASPRRIRSRLSALGGPDNLALHAPPTVLCFRLVYRSGYGTPRSLRCKVGDPNQNRGCDPLRIACNDGRTGD